MMVTEYFASFIGLVLSGSWINVEAEKAVDAIIQKF